MGILSLLDEESLFPKATDLTFVNKLHSQFNAKGHPKYIKPRFSKTAFGISHYAGEVEYETVNWLDKNKDPLQEDLSTCMKKSNISLISDLFEQNLTGVGSVDEKSKRGKGTNFVTVSMQYKVTIIFLMFLKK
jgi:myosin heavy subunit